MSKLSLMLHCCKSWAAMVMPKGSSTCLPEAVWMMPVAPVALEPFSLKVPTWNSQSTGFAR
eukprot:8791461-Lingulodinium_polyedra.AAC.1